MKKVKVIVKHRGHVPFIGHGPVTKPIFINDSQFKVLKKGGYDVEKVEEPKIKEVEVAEVVEEEIVEEQVEVEEVTEPEEEIIEEVEEEILMDDENLSAEAFYNRDFLTVSKSKEILDARGIEYSHDEKASPLKDKVEESNPETV